MLCSTQTTPPDAVYVGQSYEGCSSVPVQHLDTLGEGHRMSPQNVMGTPGCPQGCLHPSEGPCWAKPWRWAPLTTMGLAVPHREVQAAGPGPGHP